MHSYYLFISFSGDSNLKDSSPRRLIHTRESPTSIPRFKVCRQHIMAFPIEISVPKHTDAAAAAGPIQMRWQPQCIVLFEGLLLRTLM